ncbi:lipoprotein [Rhodococcus rhodnii LMG 5362]|uniref:Lipoprotein n=1 Tax=Rhodococcus rhodnii LMG 5362 TaxID=1273125 RepID=R7WL19_9NOCA|nr:lipoprotein [Rhodococcus rhodnii LMG 5362]
MVAAIAAVVLGATACAPPPSIVAAGTGAPAEAAAVADADSAEDRLDDAREYAESRDAALTAVVVDLATGASTGVDPEDPMLCASVAKLFLAAQAFHLDATGEHVLDDDRELLRTMLAGSDDLAAGVLWNEYGPDVVADVAQRYALTSTSAPVDELWWNTVSTPADIASLYQGITQDRDGLGPDRTAEFLDHLRAWTPVATDGYDQSFGLPTVLGAPPVLAPKQGWMCCIDARWVHVSSALVGDRYAVVVSVSEDVRYPDDDVMTGILPDTSWTDARDDASAAHARDTITEVVRILFPDGAVDAAWSES